METERAPGNLALITRGPAASAVRSNIVADGTGRSRHGPTAGRRDSPIGRGRSGRLSFRPDRAVPGFRVVRPSRRGPTGSRDPERGERRCARSAAVRRRIHGEHTAAAGEPVRGDGHRRRRVRIDAGRRAVPRAAAGRRTANDCAAGAAKGGGAALQVPDVVSGKFNVAMVLIGPHDDGGWSQAHYEGLQYLCQHLPDSHVAYVELVPEGTDSEQVFRSLARKGFNFIIGTSFGYMDPMATVAKDFPDITFLHLTGYKSNDTNFGNFFGAVEDFKYLAGMLAGSRAKKDGNPKVGYMATFVIPEEIRLGNAIARGVKVTCPECTIDVRFILTWHDPAEGARRRGLALRRRRRRRLHRGRCWPRTSTARNILPIYDVGEASGLVYRHAAVGALVRRHAADAGRCHGRAGADRRADRSGAGLRPRAPDRPP